MTPKIRDKDAAGAALLLAELALTEKRRGRTMLSCLEGIYEQFGYCRNEGVSLAMSGIEGKQHMIRMLNELRARPPREIGGLKVTSFEDLRDEQGRLGPIKGDTDAAARNVLVFCLGENVAIDSAAQRHRTESEDLRGGLLCPSSHQGFQ